MAARTCWKILAILLLLSALPRPAGAATNFLPVYNPASKSYFELVTLQSPLAWIHAAEAARMRVFKGVHGRLAIVRNIDTHDFLERTFHPNVPTWIGLRYWCRAHVLQWADGEIDKAGSFGAWDKNWKQDIYDCPVGGPATDYMAVAYSPIEDGFRWIGKGWTKVYSAYFTEYPTGHP